ncbi:unnamed protein product [Lampetra planeri]
MPELRARCTDGGSAHVSAPGRGVASPRRAHLLSVAEAFAASQPSPSADFAGSMRRSFWLPAVSEIGHRILQSSVRWRFTDEVCSGFTASTAARGRSRRGFAESREDAGHRVNSVSWQVAKGVALKEL